MAKHSAAHYSRRPDGNVAIPTLHRAVDRFGDESSSLERRFVLLGVAGGAQPQVEGDTAVFLGDSQSQGRAAWVGISGPAL